MRRTEPILRRALSGPCATPRGTRVLVAASGGADSTALLLGLMRIAPEFGLAIHAAHLDHGLRGAESEGDARFVGALCEALGIPLDTGRIDAAARLRDRGLSGEDGLRTLRREFLVRAARRAGCGAIATAHTADDQLETLLLRLGRGTGLPGLGGIAPRRGRRIRPLLAATRAEIEADLLRAGVPWREDSTNRGLAHARNRVRHLAVPALVAALAPARGAAPTPSDGSPAAARAGLARRAAAALSELGEVSRWIESKARRIFRRLGLIETGAVTVPVAPLRRLPRAIRLAVLRRAWTAIGTQGLRRAHLEALERLFASERSRGPVALPDGVSAGVRAGTLRFAATRAATRAAAGSAADGSGRAARVEARCGRGSRWGRVAPRRNR